MTQQIKQIGLSQWVKIIGWTHLALAATTLIAYTNILVQFIFFCLIHDPSPLCSIDPSTPPVYIIMAFTVFDTLVPIILLVSLYKRSVGFLGVSVGLLILDGVCTSLLTILSVQGFDLVTMTGMAPHVTVFSVGIPLKVTLTLVAESYRRHLLLQNEAMKADYTVDDGVFLNKGLDFSTSGQNLAP